MDELNLHIRMANESESQFISELLHQAFIQFKLLYTKEGYEATAIEGAEVLKRMKEGPVWVAVKDGNIIGTVAAVEKENGLYIRGMGVLPESRGLKVGLRLLQQADKYAEEKGIKRLFLSTTPFLDAAIKLYENYGFKRISEPPQLLFGTKLFTMEKIKK